MKPQQAAQSPAVRAFDAEVVDIDGTDLELDRTYFYAESGGQPADSGEIAGISVEHVRREDGRTIHELAQAPDLEPGTTVTCTIDDELRDYCMRSHTASHVLYGAARQCCSELGYGGFDIALPEPEGSGKVRIDFRTETSIDDDLLVDLERLANEAVWENYEVTWETVPVETVRDREDVAFNETTAEGAFGDDQVRIVTIEDWDVAACGGTHVASTGEIGPITVLERSNPGAGLTRVEFAVGPVGIERRATEQRAALAASAALDVTITELPEAVKDLRTERDQAAETLDDAVNALVEQGLQTADIVERDGKTWLVERAATLVPEALDQPGPNDLEQPVRTAAGDRADVVVVVGPGPFVVIGTDGPSAADLVERVTEAFGGGGGGSEAFAQAGGLDGSAAAIQQWFRKGE